LYLYLSLWKNKSSIKIDLSDLCDFLGLSKGYYNPSNFKKHILEPSYLILKEFNDVWFDLHCVKISKGFNGGHLLHLKVTNREMVELEEKKRNQIIDYLTYHFNFKIIDIQEINDIINSVSKDVLIEKLSYLLQYVNGQRDKPRYIKKALKKMFLI
ncbi:hypothetical protein, partial [Sphingobacterium daejeonense]